MLAARNFRSASGTLGQIALAALDLAYHTVVPGSSTRVMNRIFKEIQGRRTTPGTHFQASFGHLMGGYSAGYYGYLWSRVYAQDIFSIFEEHGVLSPEVGRRYRREILERGSSRDEDVSLEEFLQRTPSDEAFLRYLGIDPGGV
jgi:thimet oligopeptidase